MKPTATGVPKEYADSPTVVRLIELEQVETPEYAIVSVNGGFIRSDTFTETVLKDGDNVKFLYFMGGGAI